MKVLVAGDFAHRIYEEELCWGLREAGADVVELPVLRFFGPGDVLRRAQTKYVVGPGVALANAALIAACARDKPDAVLAYRTPWLLPRAIRAARAAGARLVALHNHDDPFGPDAAMPIWRAFRKAIPEADVCIYPRAINQAEYRAAGASATALQRGWYSPRLHRPLELTDGDRGRFGGDVTFVGHAEDDGRIECLEALLASGLRVRLFGTGWEALAQGRPLERLLPAPAVRGDDYCKALRAAKLALVFVSGRNRDQCTTRCFEIPACGGTMLAPRTDELKGLFTEGEDALFYEGLSELVEVASRAVADEPLRARIADAGRARVARDGHDVVSRARELLALFARL